MFLKVVFALTLASLHTSCFAESKDTFSTISENIFSQIKCVPYAYGDYNGDKRVDIFCVSGEGTQIEIWLAQEKEPLFDRFKQFSLKNSSLVTVNIIPGDFNGDSYMDLLFVSKLNDHYQMSLVTGLKTSKTNNEPNLAEELIFSEYLLTDQPLAADLNGDGKIDLLAEVFVNGTRKRKVFSFDEHGKITEPADSSASEFSLGFAHSIADINNDFIQDLIITTKSEAEHVLQFQVLTIDPQKNVYMPLFSYAGPQLGSEVVYGQSIFGDFDSDGLFEHLIPVCFGVTCHNSTIYVKNNFTNTEWIDLKVEFGSYNFIPSVESKDFWGSNTFSLKAGDYNLNGYIDLLAVLKVHNDSSSNNKDRYAILIKNVESKTNGYGRTFIIDSHILSLFAFNNVVQASFFDLYDDGYLDILLLIKDTSSSPPNYRLIALKNEDYDDVYFLKVMVIPGRCSVSQCPFQTLPYGLNYPGALVKIESTSFEYTRIVIYASQLSQSAYMALQLPYTVFGLGSTPNFVEHLTVGITSFINDDLRGFKKEWPQIIPNSQLVISPNPRYVTYNWKMQLFITPSKNILLTAISLGSTMICLVIIIGLLQFRERKMDEKERKLESQRFHFDGL